MRKLEKMKKHYVHLKDRVREMNSLRGLSPSEYMNLRKLKQLKLWYKDKIKETIEKDGV